jgi:hypothetical protein
MNRAQRRAQAARSGKSTALASVAAALSRVQSLQKATSAAAQGVASIEPALKDLSALGAQLQVALEDHDRLVKQVAMMQHVIRELGERVEPGCVKKLEADYWQSQMQETLDAAHQDASR